MSNSLAPIRMSELCAVFFGGALGTGLRYEVGTSRFGIHHATSLTTVTVGMACFMFGVTVAFSPATRPPTSRWFITGLCGGLASISLIIATSSIMATSVFKNVGFMVVTIAVGAVAMLAGVGLRTAARR